MLKATFTPSPALVVDVVRTLNKSRVLEILDVSSESRVQRLVWQSVQVLIGGLVLLLVVGAMLTSAEIKPWMVIVVAVLAYFSGAIASQLFEERNNQAYMKALVGSTLPATFTLDENGVHEVTGQTTTSTPWAGVHKVAMSDRFVFLKRSEAVIYVPRSAFNSQREMDEFAAYAASKLRRDAHPFVEQMSTS